MIAKRPKTALIFLLFLLTVPLTVFLALHAYNSRQQAQVVPTLTYMRQAIYSIDGKTSWSRDCPVDPGLGPLTEQCSNWSAPGDLTTLRGVGNEAYQSYSAFIYPKAGQQWLRQGIYLKGGKSAISRDCLVDGTGFHFEQCTAWSAPADLSNLRGVGNEAYGGFSGFTYTVNNQLTLRQTIYTLDGATGWLRDCPVDPAAGPDFTRCTGWTGPNDLTTLRGIGGERYGEFSGKVFIQNGQQVLRQTVVTLDGSATYSRNCPISATAGIQFASCTGWTGVSLDDIRQTLNGGERYGGYEEIIYTINNGTVTAKPNLVFILVDDLDLPSMQKMLALGLMPNLKKYVIDRGTTFSNAFVSNSLCCPSRATSLTGQYTHNHKTLTNNGADGGAPSFKDNDSSTIATWLHGAGYKTSFIGKYLNDYGQFSDVNKDGVINLNDATYIPPGWDNWIGLLDPFVYSMNGYRANDNGQYTTGGWLANYQPDGLGYKAAGYIQSQTVLNAPFFLYLAPAVPHIELPADTNGGAVETVNTYTDLFRLSIHPPQRYVNSVNVALPALPSFNEADITDKPAWLQAQPGMTANDIANVQKQYIERIEAMRAVDDMIGNVGAALERTGKLSNTVIMFSSDNGLQLGEHRLANKLYPYEESIRIPLYIAAPGYPAGQTTDRMAVNTDWAPTLSQFGGATPAIQVDGRSLIPVMQNPALTTWRKRFLIEHYQAPGAVVGELPTYAGVRTDKTASLNPNSTYVEYVTGEKEFYDLTLDPYELNNKPNLVSPLIPQWLQQFRTCVGAACRAIEDADVLPTVTPIPPTPTPPIPPQPGPMSVSCKTDGTATISWGASAGAASYYFRITNNTTNNTQLGACATNTVYPANYLGNRCVDAVHATSYTLPIQYDASYTTWVHAANINGYGGISTQATLDFVCKGTPPTPLPTAKPTVAPTAIPTLKPTAIPTGIGGAPTSTPKPTPVPTVAPTVKPTAGPTTKPTAFPPTNTPVPGSTRANLTVFLHGIGKGGDNVNPNGTGTANPKHPQRTVTIELFDVANNPVLTKQGALIFSATNGNFTGSIDLGTTVKSGQYTARITVEQYLKKVLPGIISLTSGQTVQLASVALTTGDVTPAPRWSSLDDTLILDCFSDLTPARNCPDAAHKNAVDITDDGDVNQFDYNLFLRELSVLPGQ